MEYTEKTPDVEEGPQTQLTYFPGQELNPGRIGERRVFLPLRHPDAPDMPLAPVSALLKSGVLKRAQSTNCSQFVSCLFLFRTLLII